ncbi:MAG: ATP-dependent DNA helicase RecG [Anaerolineae bacterium]|nr:ATP-dependent DNA helicase RecG [Anaerolineae bacterium]
MVSQSVPAGVGAALKKLAVVLRQERDQRYANRAVIGGLDAFLEHWAENAASEGLDRGFAAEVVEHLSGYGNKTPEEREQAARLVMSRLRDRFSAPPAREREQQEDITRATEATEAELDQPVEHIPGVGSLRKRQLARLGVHTIRDLLYLFPRRHDDYSALKTINRLRVGDEVSVMVRVSNVRTRQVRTNLRVITATLSDTTGSIQATWFNRRALESRLRPGRDFIVSGRVGQHLGQLNFESPEWEPLTREHLNTARLVPIYPLTEGLGHRWVRKVVKRALDTYLAAVRDPLPQELRRRLGLIDLQWAIQAMHFPADWDELDRARKRLSFDEFLVLQLGLLQRRLRAHQAPSEPLPVDDAWIEQFQSGLPFQLTGAQKRALEEIRRDMAQRHPMVRLLQGDVGSGKTVVALGAMLMAIANGKQAALMAPTEILAEQHYHGIQRLLEHTEDARFASARVALLTGSLSSQEKAATREAVADGRVNLVVGTQALIQQEVAFHDLGLVVVDEQHRFGVIQRAELAAKGRHPHVLAMSATPIPRTLALTLYGDMDVSTLDELPPGRQTIVTAWRGDRDRERIYAFLRTEVERGRQVFVICPVIEGSELEDTRAAVEEYERLRTTIFPDLRLGLLHGRLRPDEKEQTMQAFARGDLDILVSTSVVEVGIDVPNATVMMVEEAHRFGLAQLHQFRGRVGRGQHRSYCILLSDRAGELGERRLRAIENETDGFRLAEIDLELRGPGEFLGTRQSGLPDLKVARLSDMRTLELARATAQRIIADDPELIAPQHRDLRASLVRFWEPDLTTA